MLLFIVIFFILIFGNILFCMVYSWWVK